MSDQRSAGGKRRRWVPAGVVAALVMMVLVALPASTASATSPCNGPNPPDWCTPGGPPPTCTAHNLTAPTITGEIRVGKTATAAAGTWNGATEFAFQWQRDRVDISGATSRTYAIGVADSGHKLNVVVTGWSSLCDEAVATSFQTNDVTPGNPATGVRVSLQGQAKVGHVLTAVKETSTTPCVTPTYGYQWLRDGSMIAGATGTSRTLTTADWSHDLAVGLSVSCPGYLTATAQSAPLSVGYGDKPETLVPPTVSGTVAVGNTLTVDHGTWSQDPALFTYGWFRNGELVGGERTINNTYVVTADDLDSTLTVVVYASPAYHDEGSYSIAVGTVSPAGKLAYASRHATALKGTNKVGHRLSLTHSHAFIVRAFSRDATSLKYVWLRGSKVISGASKNTYLITKSDRGQKIRVRIYGVRAGYISGTYLTHSIIVKK